MHKLKTLWVVPPAAIFIGGMYYALFDGWHYIADFRLFFGHGYVLYAYTMVIMGAYGVVLTLKYGRRGLPLFFMLALGCDVAQTFFNPIANPNLPQIFVNNFGALPYFWAGGIGVMSLLSQPLEITWLSPWTVGMLLLWLFSIQVSGIVGNENFLQPMTETSWCVVAYKSVKPL